VEFLDQYRPGGSNRDCWVYGKYEPIFAADGQVEKIISAMEM